MDLIIITDASNNLPRALNVRNIASVFGTSDSPPRAAFYMIGSFQPIVATQTAAEIVARAISKGVAVDLRVP